MCRPSTSYIACHQFIDEKGRRYGPSVIRIDEMKGDARYENAFDYTERASTVWMGGTVILSPNGEQPFEQGDTLTSCINRLSSSEVHTAACLYAWHTPTLELTVPLHPLPTRICGRYTQIPSSDF